MVTYEQILDRLIGNHSESSSTKKMNCQTQSLKESLLVYLIDLKLGGMVLAEVWSFEMNVTAEKVLSSHSSGRRSSIISFGSEIKGA